MATFPVTTTDSSPWTNHRGSLPPEVDVEGNIEYKVEDQAVPPRILIAVNQITLQLRPTAGGLLAGKNLELTRPSPLFPRLSSSS
jgi:hypothetical protein